MAIRIQIEKWDANLEEVTVGRWLKEEGERVEKGEPLVEIITDKVTFEMEAPEGGVLRRILAPENSVVPVGYVIGLLGEPGEALPDVEAENRQLLEQRAAEWEALARAAQEAPPALERAEVSRGAERVRATPAARRLARQWGIDLAQVPPADGVRVTEEDVRAFLRRKGEALP